MYRTVTGQLKQWQHQGLVVRDRHPFLSFKAYSQTLNGGCRGGSRTVDLTTGIPEIRLQAIIALGFPRVHCGAGRQNLTILTRTVWQFQSDDNL
jgi:hypothetical protein